MDGSKMSHLTVDRLTRLQQRGICSTVVTCTMSAAAAVGVAVSQTTTETASRARMANYQRIMSAVLLRRRLRTTDAQQVRRLRMKALTQRLRCMIALSTAELTGTRQAVVAVSLARCMRLEEALGCKNQCK